jgi:hypothetical protein
LWVWERDEENERLSTLCDEPSLACVCEITHCWAMFSRRKMSLHTQLWWFLAMKVDIECCFISSNVIQHVKNEISLVFAIAITYKQTILTSDCFLMAFWHLDGVCVFAKSKNAVNTSDSYAIGIAVFWLWHAHLLFFASTILSYC